jgi:hypothetical protein
MTSIFELSRDIMLFLRLIEDYKDIESPEYALWNIENPKDLESSEFTLWNYEYEDLGGRYGTNVGNRMYDIDSISFDEKVVITGHLKFLPHLDYISLGSGGEIMNQKTLDALLSVGDFPYEKLPCRIMDVESLGLGHDSEYRQYKNDDLAAKYPHNDDYFFLHLTSHTSLPQGLRTDPAGLPPILVPDPKDRLFGTYVTQQGKDALIAAQIHGVDFTVPYQYQEPLQN